MTHFNKNNLKQVFRVRTQYIFEGVYEIAADSKEEARRKVMEECGLVMGGRIHSLLSDGEVDWDFPIHPEVKVRHVRRTSPRKP